MGVCRFEVGKVGQPDVGQEADQHSGDECALICERYFGMRHDAPPQFRPALARGTTNLANGRLAGTLQRLLGLNRKYCKGPNSTLLPADIVTFVCSATMSSAITDAPREVAVVR